MTGKTAALLFATLGFSIPAFADGVRDQAETAGVESRASTDWLAFEAPVGLAQGQGSLPAISLFRDNGVGALGLRLRAGVLTSDAQMATASGRELVGALGFGLRRRFGLAWVELGGGVAATRHGFAPEIEAATGVTFSFAGLTAGPSLRYIRIDEAAAGGGALDSLMLGAEVQLMRRQRRPTTQTSSYVQAPAPQQLGGASCADNPLPCERELAAAIDAGLVTIGNDRIIIDVHALLSTTNRTVHDTGAAIIAGIVHRQRAQPQWRRTRIEGYAEMASSDLENWKMSQGWAKHVRATFLAVGAEPAQVHAIGYGRLQATSAASSARPSNRIELVIERSELLQ